MTSVENPGVIGLATASIASAATVGGAVTFARLAPPDPMLPVVLAVCAVGFGDVPRGQRPAAGHRGGRQLCGHRHAAARPSHQCHVPPGVRGPGPRHGAVDAAFFGGEFVCPLVLLAGESAVGSLAGAGGVLGLAAALVAAGLWAARRRVGAVDPRPLPEQLA